MTNQPSPDMGQSVSDGEFDSKLWLWKNFVDDRPEYWAFDNPFPCHPNGDPMVLGEPCGYALFEKSKNGQPNVQLQKVLDAVTAVAKAAAERFRAPVGGDGELREDIALEIRRAMQDEMCDGPGPSCKFRTDTALEYADAILSLLDRALAVPDGWRLVPVKPTDEMMVVGAGEVDRTNPYKCNVVTNIWSAMLSTAPTLPIAKGDKR